MTICREWSLVKHLPDTRHAKPLYCRSWNCEICRPKRKSQLLALAASGLPNRFLTLTVNPAKGHDSEERLRLLTHAWKVVVKRLRRKYGKDSINYLAVVESTKAGEPHLHILLRSPFLPQAELSAAMRELIDAPIVDIRLIRNQREVVRYVAKYVTKAPTQFGSAKRYWQTPGYELDKLVTTDKQERSASPWRVDQRPMHEILAEWIADGYAPRRETDDVLIGVYVGWEGSTRSPPPFATVPWTPLLVKSPAQPTGLQGSLVGLD